MPDRHAEVAVTGGMTGGLRSTDPARLGPYRVLRRLGHGGMGQVFLAQSPGGRAVAIKVIHPELAVRGGFRSRFAREVAAARTVNGMFTAAVIDADPDAELPWMATAFVQGPSLADAVEEQGPLAPQAVLSLAAGLAEGLQAIHRAGLVHRDLKPSNVLLAGDGPRIIDFGISWAREQNRLTDAGIVVGSPGFLSPEQATGRDVGPASDVFCLGALLTYAATGQEPFGLGSTQALLYRVVHEPPDLSAVPGQLRPLISACLAKDPGHRPTTAQLLARLADSLAPPAAADELAMAAPGARASRQSATGRPVTGLSLAGVPATGDRLAAGHEAGHEAPGTRRPGAQVRQGGTETDPDTAADPGDSTRRLRPGSRRAGWRWWWPATAALAGALLAGGVVMALAPSGHGRPAGPAGPAPRVVPHVSGATHGKAGAATPSAGPSATRPSPAATVPAIASTGPGKAPASTAPASARTTPARQPSGPSPAPPAATRTSPPATPTAQPSTTAPPPNCFLLCIG